MTGDTEVITDKTDVDNAIGEYFTNIYKRPDHMQLRSDQIDFNVDGDMQIDTSSTDTHTSPSPSKRYKKQRRTATSIRDLDQIALMET